MMTDAMSRGAALQRARRWTEAEALYRAVLAAAPGCSAALHQLGVVRLRSGRLGEAVDSLTAALPLATGAERAEVHLALATALRRLGRPSSALEHYRAVVALQPGSAEARLNLGAALADVESYGEAADALSHALALDPALMAAREAMAVVLNRLGRHDEVQALLRHPAVAAPTPLLRKALAEALKAQGRLGEAAEALRSVLRNAPDDLEATYNLGVVLKDQGETQAAVATFRNLVQARPASAPARLALCMAHLAPLYGDETALAAGRAAYAAELAALAAWADTVPPDALADAVGASQPFYLAYQQEDDVALQRLYGRLVCRAMAARYPPVPLAGPPQPGERLRVGIVSGFFRDHANWRLPVRGWVEGLDRGRFALFGYHTSALQDATTSAAAAAFDRFVQGPLSTDAWRRRIAEDRPHVLIYPEVGMDPAGVRLAAQRLAPVQCNSWGHPVTSGLPTLDYFLSSADMEPDRAQTAYTERLVRLSGLSTKVALPDVPPRTPRAALGLRAGATVFWCAQSPYKYLPRDDDVFPRIAEGAGDCQFVFTAFPGSDALTNRFRRRLEDTFAARGLEAARFCVILPRLEATAFRAAMGAADVALDSLGWSGCNSLLEALACGLPIVTLEGSTLRGRHGAALLRRAGLAEAVMTGKPTYVDLAIRLASDPALRRRLAPPAREILTARLNGEAAVEPLQDFLLWATGRAAGDSNPGCSPGG